MEKVVFTLPGRSRAGADQHANVSSLCPVAHLLLSGYFWRGAAVVSAYRRRRISAKMIHTSLF